MRIKYDLLLKFNEFMIKIASAAVLGGRAGGGSAVRSRPIDYDYATGSTFSVKVNGKPVFLLGDFRKKVDATVKVVAPSPSVSNGDLID